MVKPDENLKTRRNYLKNTLIIFKKNRKIIEKNRLKNLKNPRKIEK